MSSSVNSHAVRRIYSDRAPTGITSEDKAASDKAAARNKEFRNQVTGRCGDGFKGRHEYCDDGNRNNNDACTNSCNTARCGDSIVKTGVEECDDGNRNNFDACRSDCTLLRRCNSDTACPANQYCTTDPELLVRLGPGHGSRCQPCSIRTDNPTLCGFDGTSHSDSNSIGCAHTTVLHAGACANPPSGQRVIYFSGLSGPDNILGTGDDIAFTSYADDRRIIDTEYSNLGVTFSGSPQIDFVVGINSPPLPSPFSSVVRVNYDFGIWGSGPLTMIFDTPQLEITFDLNPGSANAMNPTSMQVTLYAVDGSSNTFTLRTRRPLLSDRLLPALCRPSESCTVESLEIPYSGSAASLDELPTGRYTIMSSTGVYFNRVVLHVSAPNNGSYTLDNLTYDISSP